MFSSARHARLEKIGGNFDKGIALFRGYAATGEQLARTP